MKLRIFPHLFAIPHILIFGWANASGKMERPKRSVARVNYAELVNLKIPAAQQSKNHMGLASSVKEDSGCDTLYHLSIVQRKPEEGLVKVRYVGYGREFDEWRVEGEVINLSEEESDSDEGGYAGFRCPISCQMTVFNDLVYRVKSLLTSNRKGDPTCRIVMPFDQVSFDALSLCCTLVNRAAKLPVYRVPDMLKLNDLLGDRWYIRGLNPAGDFCYIVHDTIKLYLKQAKGKPDYQWRDDGTIVKSYFGAHLQLMLSFVRGDGVASQWSEIVNGQY